MGNPVQVFFGFAGPDRAAVARFERHLSPLRERVVVWHRDLVLAGDEAEIDVERRMREAALLVLFLSADYLSAPEGEAELRWALQRHQQGARVMAVRLRSFLMDERLRDLPILPAGEPLLQRAAEAQDPVWAELARQVGALVQGGEAPWQPEPAGLPYHPAWYVPRRRGEAIAWARLSRGGGNVTALCGAEGSGKGALLGRLLELVAQERPAARVVRVDLRRFDRDSFRGAEDFLFELAQHLLSAAPLSSEAADYLNRWPRRPGTPQGKVTRLLQRFILPGEGRALLVVEGLDRLLDQPPESGVLDLLRSWAEDEQLRILVLASTDFFPVTAQGTSPFLNVTERVPLGDFSEDEVRELGRLYRISLGTGELQGLRERVGGNPYLLRTVLFDCAVRRRAPLDAVADGEIFATHLGRLSRWLRSHPDLEQGFLTVARGSGRLGRTVGLRLEGEGLILKKGGDGYRLRYPLYEALVD